MILQILKCLLSEVLNTLQGYCEMKYLPLLCYMDMSCDYFFLKAKKVLLNNSDFDIVIGYLRTSIRQQSATRQLSLR